VSLHLAAGKRAHRNFVRAHPGGFVVFSPRFQTMSDLIKDAAKRGLKKAARWASTGKNVPRLKGLQAWWQRHVGEQNEINSLREQYAGLIHAPTPRKLLATHERKVHSQFGEDGLLLHFFSKIGAPNQTFIEFGIEDGTECNAANLALHFGWGGLLMDGSDSLADSARTFYHKRHGIAPEHVQIRTEFITKENVNDLFTQYGFKGELDMLSLDIDGVDYWIWDAITVVSPRLVIIEFNASFGPDRSVTVPYEPSFERYAHHESGWYHGASLKAFTKLAAKKGYFLAGCDTAGANAIFIRRDIGQGKVAEFTPEEAFYPHTARLREASVEGQWDRVKHLPMIEI
jgi:hypothetical protein